MFTHLPLIEENASNYHGNIEALIMNRTKYGDAAMRMRFICYEKERKYALHGPVDCIFGPAAEMARPAGFEPAAYRLEGGCSIH